MACRGFDPAGSLDRRRRAAVVVGLAIGLHAALLLGGRTGGVADRPLQTTSPRVVSVRMLAVAAETPAPRVAAVPTAAPAPSTSPGRSPEPPPRPAPVTTGLAEPAVGAPPVRVRPPPAAAVDLSPAFDPAPLASTGAAAAPATLPPAPDYLPARSLDVPPRPLQDIDPAYPKEGQLRSGSVVLRLLIDERGDVADASVVRSFPKALFDASALEAFGSAKFSPGQRDGVPVKSQMTIEVAFTPMNRGATVSGRSY